MKIVHASNARIRARQRPCSRLWLWFASFWLSSCHRCPVHNLLNQVSIIGILAMALKISTPYLLYSQILCHIVKFSPKIIFCEGKCTRRCASTSDCMHCTVPNFQLNFLSQLIHVDWPLSIMSLFDWVRFFSFSINVVRPECAFSWKFQTKVIVTLLTPISLSLLTFICGFIYGMIACFKTWRHLERERQESGKYARISYLSTLSCW